MKTMSYEEWRKTITINMPEDTAEALKRLGVDIAKETEDVLKVEYDAYICEEAFKFEMTGCQYGEEETADARYWFSRGWQQKQKRLELDRSVSVHDHFDVPMEPDSEDGKDTLRKMDHYIKTGELT